jgi:hypothetical protein
LKAAERQHASNTSIAISDRLDSDNPLEQLEAEFLKALVIRLYHTHFAGKASATLQELVAGGVLARSWSL